MAICFAQAGLRHLFFMLAALMAGAVLAPSSASAQEGRQDFTIEVVARGTTGTEVIGIQLDGQTVHTWDLSNSLATYSHTFADTGFEVLHVAFINDGYDPIEGDRNVYFDSISQNGARLDPTTLLSKGSWNGTDCGEGFRNSNWLHCNGWFELFHRPAAFMDASLIARGTTGTERIALEVDGIIEAEWALTTELAERFFADFPAREYETVRFLFVNDGYDPVGGDRNVFIESLFFDGLWYNPVELKSKGSWNGTDCGEGFRNSNWLHCNGWFEIAGDDSPPPPPPPPPEDTVLLGTFLRGTTGTEEVGVEVNGTMFGTARLGTTSEWIDANIPLDLFVNGDPADPANVMRLVFLNDGYDPVGGDRNVFVESFEFDGVIFNPRDLKSKGSWNGADCGEGFRNSNWLHCNGWFEVLGEDAPPPPPPPEDIVFVDVVARGTTGTEKLSLELNGELLEIGFEGDFSTTWELTTAVTPYFFNVPLEFFVNSDPSDPANVMRVLFVNDGSHNGMDRNVYFTEFGYDTLALDPKSLKSKGTWNGTDCGEGFRNSNWLHCNGWFELTSGG